MTTLYICESHPAAVSYTAGRGAVGDSLGGSGRILTSGTFAAAGVGNAVHRTYRGPTIGVVNNFSGTVNGTTTLFLVDNGPTFGRMLSAT